MLKTKNRGPTISRPLFLCENRGEKNKIKTAQLTQINHQEEGRNRDGKKGGGLSMWGRGSHYSSRSQ
jgi:hypothetical protein